VCVCVGRYTLCARPCVQAIVRVGVVALPRCVASLFRELCVVVVVVVCMISTALQLQMVVASNHFASQVHSWSCCCSVVVLLSACTAHNDNQTTRGFE
jgi:hypothetical protein